MTKEEAWQEWKRTLCTDECDLDSINSVIDIGDCQDAFEWGWDKAVQSFTPHALPDPVPYKEVIDIFNKVFSDRPKPINVTASYRRYIHARWEEGMRLEDFEAVCRIKKSQWDHDPKMRSFLRPETLFSNKMMTYRNEEEEGSRCTVAEGQ